MKDIVKQFSKDHPFLTVSLAGTVLNFIHNTVVDTVRAITGNYPEDRVTTTEIPVDALKEKTKEILIKEPEEKEEEDNVEDLLS